jgi:predicted AAA+ superfamily ATPase
MIDTSSATGYLAVQHNLQARLREPPPGKLQLLVGPRQVGKTTLLLSLAREWKDRCLYARADAPEAALPSWADQIWRQAEELTRRGSALLLLDEIQYLPKWSQWLKARFDRTVRDRLPLHVVATGSSALKVGAGTKETMAGRFERLTLTHWSAGDLTSLLGVPAELAAERVVTHGGYPGAVAYWEEPERWRAYLRDAIIEPAIGRDLLHLEVVRRPALLRQLFALAVTHPAEILSLDKIAGALAGKGALDTIAHYLGLLQEAFLVAGVRKYAGDELRRRRSPPKLLVLNNALLAGSRAQPPPRPDTAPAEWGRWVENACLAFAFNSGQEVYYWREEPWKVDGVIRGSWGQWLVEVKTGEFGPADLRGLAAAASKFPRFKPVVICDPQKEARAGATGYRTISWTDFLRHGLSGL